MIGARKTLVRETQNKKVRDRSVFFGEERGLKKVEDVGQSDSDRECSTQFQQPNPGEKNEVASFVECDSADRVFSVCAIRL